MKRATLWERKKTYMVYRGGDPFSTPAPAPAPAPPLYRASTFDTDRGLRLVAVAASSPPSPLLPSSSRKARFRWEGLPPLPPSPPTPPPPFAVFSSSNSVSDRERIWPSRTLLLPGSGRSAGDREVVLGARRGEARRPRDGDKTTAGLVDAMHYNTQDGCMSPGDDVMPSINGGPRTSSATRWPLSRGAGTWERGAVNKKDTVCSTTAVAPLKKWQQRAPSLLQLDNILLSARMPRLLC